MLFLTRKLGESIIINDEIVVRVEAIHSTTVRLSFVYPTHCRVLREELYEKIKAENQAASASVDNIQALLKPKEDRQLPNVHSES